MKLTLSAERCICSPSLFIADKGSDSPLLICSIPAWPGSAFDVLDDYTVRYRVGAKESDAPVHDFLVFLRRALHPVVRGEFRKIGARVDDREVTIAVEYCDALRIWAKRLNRTAVRSGVGIRLESPGSNQVLDGLGASTGNSSPEA